MATICPAKKRSTKGKPKPKSTTTVIQLQQQKNKNSAQQQQQQQQASQVGAQNASPSATTIDKSVRLEREIAMPSSACIENRKKKKKRTRKAGKAKNAGHTHQMQPSSSSAGAFGASSDIQEAKANATATKAVQSVVSIERTPATPNLLSQSTQPASSSSHHQQQQQQASEDRIGAITSQQQQQAVCVQEQEEQPLMSFDNMLGMCDVALQDSYRLVEGSVKLRHALDLHTFSTQASLQRQHPDETARTIASMRVQHEQEIKQLYADHCKRTADDNEAIRTAYREHIERAEQERRKEEDAWQRKVDFMRRDSERKYARMVEDGHRMAERSRLGPLIRSRRVKHFADAG